MEQTDFLLARMNDLAAKAVGIGFAVSKFLTPSEAQSVAVRFSRNRDVALTFDGGFEDAERTRATFLNPDWGGVDRTDLFAALRIECREMLGHRDVLGSLMGLGIERETVGDIVCRVNTAVLVCLPEISGYIAENLTKIGRESVKLAIVGLDELPNNRQEPTVKIDTVASLRLDAVLSVAFGLSRSKAADLIEASRVSLNHKRCLQPAKELQENAVISVRGMGRVKLLEIGGTSKKGRIFIKVGVYGR